MSEHEVSRVLSVPSAAAFAVAADLERLPEWLPTVEHAEPAADGGPGVHVDGDSSGGHYESEGFWRPSPNQRRVEWGSESRGAPEAYSGWLQVHDRDAGCEVVVHLSFYERDPGPGVDEGLARSLEALAGLVGP